MPSLAVTPLQLTITWGEVATQPPRTATGALMLRLTFGNLACGPGTAETLSVTTPKLDRAAQMFPIGEVRGGIVYFSASEQNRQQRVLEGIEKAFAAISARDDNQDSVLARIQAALNLASAANDKGTEALNSIKIANSYTDPSAILTADNTGTITVAAHTRVYGDGTRVAVNAGSVSGLAAGAYVTVFYLDAGYAGGAVTYQGTIDAVAQQGTTHVCGSLTIPQAGAVSVVGGGVSAPGYTPPTDSKRSSYLEI